MSELNVYHHELRPGEYDEFYLKYEADKVIVELEDKAAQYKVLYKELCRDINTQERFFAKDRAHSKYKRCLAMARWCDEVMLSCELRGCTVHRIWANKHKWAMRWKYRWLELAEKFKEAK